VFVVCTKTSEQPTGLYGLEHQRLKKKVSRRFKVTAEYELYRRCVYDGHLAAAAAAVVVAVVVVFVVVVVSCGRRSLLHSSSVVLSLALPKLVSSRRVAMVTGVIGLCIGNTSRCAVCCSLST